jgi:prolyl 4-hydroxylase
MATQLVTPALRQWLSEQTAAGQRPESLLAAMAESGWAHGVALQALEATLASLRSESEPLVKRLPQLVGPDGAATIFADGHQIQVRASLASPSLAVLGNVLSDEECASLMEDARPRLSRSETVVTSTGGSEVNEARTSQGMFFGRGETAICQRIEARIAAMLDWPVENGEGIQILRYGPGAEYRPHYDYFDPEQPGTDLILKRGGQRVATLVIYLNTPEVGGGTVFPDLGLTVAALKGQAVFFSYAQPLPSTRTLHGGAPVLQGEKWVATKWLRARKFE